ncbi:MAG: HAD-IA family hydrolase [Chloroflexota bacterium]|nr:HAD-IA family hydrolase [Chloroflexota bacterium]
MRHNSTIRGLIFDFDGLILETESPIFVATRELYQSFGQELSLGTWAKVIGISPDEHDPVADLEALVGISLDREKLRAKLSRRENELVLTQEVLPGVEDYIVAAKENGLKLAIASSSSRKWVLGHLERLQLLRYFDAVCCSDDVERAKPDPALYKLALEKIGLKPSQAIVFEDSPNGVLAAKRANLFCVAIPTALIAHLSLDHADLVLGSLADVSLDELLNQLGSGKY